MSSSTASARDLRWYQGIDRKLWIILAVTYVGWLLDSMDLNLFTVVLVPSLRELDGATGEPADHRLLRRCHRCGAIARLGCWWTDLRHSRRLLGAGADAVSVHRRLCAVHGHVRVRGDVVAARDLPHSHGGRRRRRMEAIGTALINETWPQRSRVAASGVMMSAFGFGYLLAGLINLLVGSYGWRWVFFTGVIPALLVAFVWREVPESERWKNAQNQRNDAPPRPRMLSGTALRLGRGQNTHHLHLPRAVSARPGCAATPLAATDHVVCGDRRASGAPRPGSPPAPRSFATAGGANPVQVISIAVIILNCAAVIGLLLFAWLTELIGRRPAFAVGCIGNMIVLPIVFLTPQDYQTLSGCCCR